MLARNIKIDFLLVVDPYLISEVIEFHVFDS